MNCTYLLVDVRQFIYVSVNGSPPPKKKTKKQKTPHYILCGRFIMDQNILSIKTSVIEQK